MRKIRTLTAVLLCAIAVMSQLYTVMGQTNRGGITGTIVDSNGAVVAGATVTITNVGTNQVTKLTTSEAGSYTAASLEPVLYRITVEAAGFKKAVMGTVKVDTATTATVNITLEAGAVDAS